MLRPYSIVDVVRELAERRPDDTAHSIVANGSARGRNYRRLGHQNIDSAARGITSTLLNSCRPGDRVPFSGGSGSKSRAAAARPYARDGPFPLPLPILA
jgi:acyl-CoA synthetase (AMP-forming)/AMP-acid ligase II